MARYQVPQRIDMQDRIVGPLTLYQFIYLLFGGMIFYIPFKSQSILGIVFVGIPAALLALAFAFLKIQDQSFGRFITALIAYAMRPKVRVWHKGDSLATLNINPSKSTAQNTSVVTKSITPEQFKSLASHLDEK